MTERFQEIENGEDGMRFNQNAYVRDGGEEARETISDFLNPANVSSAQNPKLPLSRSVLSMIGNIPNVASKYPHISGFADDLERIAIYNDWVFGSGSNIRKLQRSGFESNRLVGDSINLAQVLKAMRDRGDQTVFESLIELMRKFYEPVKDVDTELLGTDLRIMIKEDGLSSRTPAERLSDGTLRWLMLLIVLLDPAPPPVICIEEPELGIHPDMLPTLADLLVEASARTQLIVTTHSRSLIDSFSENPDAVCICEKVQGSTVIERLDRVRLKVWLDKYSLGRLWTSGEIGGNRW
jgi:predicted ATPase